eukprot:TRINITY_DN4065_c0_g1_i1.p1 TRINITY_DN4065_c0_g1~~TRINITY_DN4065_c0_g1_i1.p1  ORF type:complete len:395 (+),score=55.29 TRINITY_DN4065_c0_g1_i1:224-1408(+)
MTSTRAVTGLREVAHLYKSFLLSAGPLSGGSLICARNLVDRDKHVALVQATPAPASAILRVGRANGLPQDVASWTSGEFVRHCLSTVDYAELPRCPAPLQKPRPLRVFELSSISMPRNLKELARRGEPPLADLQNLGSIRRVSDIARADVCYWDLPEGDHLGELLEASLELCADNRVPLVHASRSATASIALESIPTTRGTPEDAAASLTRLGGSAFGVGKLDGYTDGLRLHELDPVDILLISDNIGDIAEAADHGVHVLLLLGSVARGQLSAFADAGRQAKAAARQFASVTQRIGEDSPAMLAAANSPFLSFLKLPTLLKETMQRNAEHRKRTAAAVVASTAAKEAPIQVETDVSAPSEEDYLDLLRSWCTANQVEMPVGVVLGPLTWDGSEE